MLPMDFVFVSLLVAATILAMDPYLIHGLERTCKFGGVWYSIPGLGEEFLMEVGSWCPIPGMRTEFVIERGSWCPILGLEAELLIEEGSWYPILGLGAEFLTKWGSRCPIPKLGTNLFMLIVTTILIDILGGD